jgi:hypothetical protein
MATKQQSTSTSNGWPEGLEYAEGMVVPASAVRGPNPVKMDYPRKTPVPLRSRGLLPLRQVEGGDYLLVDDRDLFCYLPEPSEECRVGRAPSPFVADVTGEGALLQTWLKSGAFEELFGVAELHNRGGETELRELGEFQVGPHRFDGGVACVQNDLELWGPGRCLVGEAKTINGLKGGRTISRRQPLLGTLAVLKKIETAEAAGDTLFSGATVTSFVFLIRDAHEAELHLLSPLRGPIPTCDRSTGFVPERSILLRRPRR